MLPMVAASLLEKPHVDLMALEIGLVSLLDELARLVESAVPCNLDRLDVVGLGHADGGDDLEARLLHRAHVVIKPGWSVSAMAYLLGVDGGDGVGDDLLGVHAAVVCHGDDDHGYLAVHGLTASSLA